MKEVKSIKKLAESYYDRSYKELDIGDCFGSKTQLVLNYCYKKYGEKSMDKFSNACIRFDYELIKLNYVKKGD